MIIDDRYREVRSHVLRLLIEALHENGEHNSANKIRDYLRWHTDDPMNPPSWFREEGYGKPHTPISSLHEQDSACIDFNNAGEAYSDIEID